MAGKAVSIFLKYLSLLHSSLFYSTCFRFKSQTSSFTSSFTSTLIYRRSSSCTCTYTFVHIHSPTRRLHQPRGLSFSLLFLPSRPWKYPAGLSRSSIADLTALPSLFFFPSHPSDPIYRGPFALLPVISHLRHDHHPFFIFCCGLLSQSSYCAVHFQ